MGLLDVKLMKRIRLALDERLENQTELDQEESK